MVVSTYQAASGAGAAAMEELEQQTREVQFIPMFLSLLGGHPRFLKFETNMKFPTVLTVD